MATQNKTGWRSSGKGQLLAGLALLIPVLVNAQSRSNTSVMTARQAADQLVARTRPGYHTSILIPDWRARGQDQTQAIAAVTGLCQRAHSAPAASPSLHFSGERLDKEQVQLAWTVSQAATGLDFSIERSQQATAGFEPVLSVKSRDATASVNTYQTIDANRSAEFSYYRIQWTDRTGAQTYSAVIAVDGERPRYTVNAFPNPGSQKNMTFELAGSAPDQSLEVTIYDVQGRVLYQHNRAVQNAAHQLTLPDGVDFPAGLYYVRIASGPQVASIPFIIQP